MRTALLVVTSLSAVSAFAICSLFAYESSPPTAEIAPSASAVAAPVPKPPRDDRALRQLQADVDDLYARQDDLEQNLSASPPQDIPATPEEDAAHAQQVAERIQNALDQEPSDPRWSPVAEDSLRGWADERSGIQLQDVRCSASLCRLIMGFDDVQTRTTTMAALWHQSPWPGGGFGRALDEEGLVYEVYLAREGRSLPSA